LMNADGTNRVQLTCPGADSDFWPSWSPDGTLIAFARGQATYVMNEDGTNLHRVADGTGASFSPDGTKLAFAATTPAPGIYVANVDGTNARLVVSGNAWDPVWSPDGSELAFARKNELEVVHADGSGESTLVASLNVNQLDWARTSGPTVVERDVAAQQT